MLAFVKLDRCCWKTSPHTCADIRVGFGTFELISANAWSSLLFGGKPELLEALVEEAIAIEQWETGARAQRCRSN
jgi:hypothetical protein